MHKVPNTMHAIMANCLLLLSLIAAGCAATQVKQVWTDQSYEKGSLKSVLIVALVYDQSTRRMFESEFAKYFKYRGINAIESFRDLEIKSLNQDALREAILEKMRENNSDTVLLTRVVDRRTKEDIIPGMTITSGIGRWGASASAAAVYSFPGPSAPTTQGYSHEETFLGIVTNVFDARTEKLIWSICTETRISSTPQEEIKPYVALVTKKLFRSKLFR
jgi:hypothetical protein